MEQSDSTTEDPSTVRERQAIHEEGSLFVMDCDYCVVKTDATWFCPSLYRIGVANKIYCDEPEEL